ncbi:MAG: hypothetical protein D6E12_18815 [Desulfovibrio sp.]|nr:MAG: hypothetical protein D6E12_18815 [Desulfovibrio sp.]
MIDIDITLVIQFVIFIVTFLAMNFILIKPIREIIKKRDGLVSGMVEDAEKFADDAESKLANYEAQLAEARAAGVTERTTVKDQAMEEEKAILSKAADETAAELSAVRDQVAGDVKGAMDTLTGQVGSMAEKVAAKVLG